MAVTTANIVCLVRETKTNGNVIMHTWWEIKENGRKNI